MRAYLTKALSLRERLFPAAASIPIAIAVAFTLAGCARKALPELGSPGAQLYAERCGQCHAPYNPRAMTAEMWRVQVSMMEDKMRQSRLPPLTEADRATIIDYLSRNASN